MNYNENKMHVRIHFTEDVLGTSPNNEQLYRDYIGSKAPDSASMEEEIESLGADGVAEKGTTVFQKFANGHPFLYDYQIKGFFKGACGACRKFPGSLSSKQKAYKKVIDEGIFVDERRVEIKDYGAIDYLERPLRASTPMGERVSLARSEVISAGAWIEFDIVYYNADWRDLIVEWLDYGKRWGIGQWRNASYGRFEYEIIEDGNVIGGNYSGNV